jgi:hypothetical protein
MRSTEGHVHFAEPVSQARAASHAAPKVASADKHEGADLSESVLIAALALLGVALTAAIQFVTAWHWGALPRRISELAALIQKLPPAQSGPLQALLGDEIAMYVAQEKRRRDDAGSERIVWVIRLTWLTRLSLTCWVLAALVRGFLLPRLGVEDGELADMWAANVAGAFAVIALVAVFWKAFRRWRHRRKSKRGPEA